VGPSCWRLATLRATQPPQSARGGTVGDCLVAPWAVPLRPPRLTGKPSWRSNPTSLVSLAVSPLPRAWLRVAPQVYHFSHQGGNAPPGLPAISTWRRAVCTRATGSTGLAMAWAIGVRLRLARVDLAASRSAFASDPCRHRSASPQPWFPRTAPQGTATRDAVPALGSAGVPLRG